MRESGSTLVTVVVIFVAAILMFVFPLAAISEMNDSETLAMLQAYTTEFTDEIRTNGMITKESYDTFVQKIHSLGITCDVEFEIQIADVNPGKKNQNQQMGDTASYSVFTPQVTDSLDNNGVYPLKEGDFVVVIAKITNTSIADMIHGVIYFISGDSSYQKYAQASGTVTQTGSIR